jgi:hypothetical protein
MWGLHIASSVHNLIMIPPEDLKGIPTNAWVGKGNFYWLPINGGVGWEAVHDRLWTDDSGIGQRAVEVVLEYVGAHKVGSRMRIAGAAFLQVGT